MFLAGVVPNKIVVNKVVERSGLKKAVAPDFQNMLIVLTTSMLAVLQLHAREISTTGNVCETILQHID